MSQLKRRRRDVKSDMTEAVFLRVSPEAKERIGQLTERLRVGASAIVDQIFTERHQQIVELAVDALTSRVMGPSPAAVSSARAAKAARAAAPRKRPNQGKVKR